jgi:hypothetical protein
MYLRKSPGLVLIVLLFIAGTACLRSATVPALRVSIEVGDLVGFTRLLKD